MLYAITPCSRPSNLSRIKCSIPQDMKWCVVYDKPTQEDKELQADYIYRAISKSSLGDSCRNFALDNLPLKDGDWIYYLDDDNLIHPNLLNIELDDNYAVIAFFQNYKNATRFNKIKIVSCCIDGGACLFNWRLVKNIRWTLPHHIHDYIYIRDCLTCGPLKEVHEVASYYNALEWM